MKKISGKTTNNLNIILSFFMAFVISVLTLCPNIGGTEKVYAATYVAYIGTKGYDSLSSAINAASSGSTITLSADITNSSILSISKTVTINGCGHKVYNYGFAQTAGTLTLKNIIFDGKNMSTSNYMFTNASGSTLNLQNGAIIKNFSGIGFASLNIRGTINMYDGSSLTNLKGLYGDVRLDSSGATFNMYGGTITTNSSSNTSSSSYHEGVVLYLSNGSTMNMSGGTIIDNKYGSYAVPGTIFLHATGTNRFNMTGGIITKNSASYGGAVYNNGTSNVITVSGTAQIYDNSGSSMASGISNIYLKNEQYITIGTNHMGTNSSVGVYTQTNVTNSNDVKFAINANISDAAHFTSDYSSNAGIVYCDGTNDYSANGAKISAHHTKHFAGTLWLSTAAAHVHNWKYEVAGNELDAYCVGTVNSSICAYNGSENAARLVLEADDWIYGSGTYNGAEIINELTAAVSMNVSDVSYFMTENKGETTGGNAIDEPYSVGYYYAMIKVGNYTLVDDFVIEREKLTYHTESLNNKFDENGALIKKVSGNGATTDLKVVLTDNGDEIKLYKIADSNWNNVSEEYEALQWNEAVAGWIRSTSYDTPIYSSIENLGAASNSIWSGFFNDMLINTGNIVDELDEIDLSKYSYEKNEANEAEKANIRLYGLEFGTYAILATDEGGKKYNPLVVNVYPQMNGPAYYSYVESLITVYLKDAIVSIDKTINNLKMDIVEIGQTVDFAVEFSMPALYNDRVTLSSTNDTSVKKYTLYFEDKMSEAFKMVDGTLKVEYKENASDTEWKELQNTDVNYYAFVTGSYTGSKTLVTAENGPIISTDTNYNTDLTGQYYASKSSKLYAISSKDTVSNYGIKETTTRLEFNEGALKAWLKKDNTSNNISHVRITYQATVTKNVQAGSENNYNTAYIYYEANNSGTAINSEQSTVRGYTYAVRVLKIDGDTQFLEDGSINSNPTYISGAVFDLYKETDIFLDGQWLSATETGEQDKGKLEDFKKNHANYYYYEESYEESSGDDGASEKHVLTRAFKPYQMGFASVATANGYVVNGLNEGNYVLSEKAAPTGYKKLAEDMLFGINRLSDDEAVLSNQGSLSAFFDNEGQLNTSGIHVINVLNYKGLNLPSTGGLGTVLFTVLGVFIMTTAFILVILRRKCQKDMDLFS